VRRRRVARPDDANCASIHPSGRQRFVRRADDAQAAPSDHRVGTTCTVVKTVSNTTVTPSGKISYVTNGTVERTITFVFGGTYSFTSSIHMHGLRADDEVQEESDHYSSQWEHVSGAYHLVCVESYDVHWANGNAQPSSFELYCVPA
jgi:hypothetical protein